MSGCRSGWAGGAAGSHWLGQRATGSARARCCCPARAAYLVMCRESAGTSSPSIPVAMACSAHGVSRLCHAQCNTPSVSMLYIQYEGITAQWLAMEETFEPLTVSEFLGDLYRVEIPEKASRGCSLPTNESMACSRLVRDPRSCSSIACLLATAFKLNCSYMEAREVLLPAAGRYGSCVPLAPIIPSHRISYLRLGVLGGHSPNFIQCRRKFCRWMRHAESCSQLRG